MSGCDTHHFCTGCPCIRDRQTNTHTHTHTHTHNATAQDGPYPPSLPCDWWFFLGTAWTMLLEWNNLGCGLCCSSRCCRCSRRTGAAWAKERSAIFGRLPFFTSALYICFSFSFSVCRFKLKFSGAFSIGGSCEFGKETDLRNSSVSTPHGL